MIALLIALTARPGHAHLLTACFEKLRPDRDEVKILRAVDERGLRLAEPIEVLVQRGDRVRLKIFDGPAAASIRAANRDARIAETIRGVNYHDQRGLDQAYDRAAAAARTRAFAEARLVDVVAGEGIKLITLKRVLEDARWRWTPRDVIWSRQYLVPKAVLLDPVDPGRARKSDWTAAIESEDMLAEEAARRK